MNMQIDHVTLREICGDESRFPEYLRSIICRAVEDIPPGEMPELQRKHESDPNNFDGRIADNIRSHSQDDISISANHPVSNHTRFNCDVAIYIGNDSVCLEIEKGNKSRFELDILKMQVFADIELRKTPQRQAYGAFVVPKDNVVDSHITGDHRESSYEYLIRLSHLLCEMESLTLSDILFVGYSEPEEVEVRSHETPDYGPIDQQASNLQSIENLSEGINLIRRTLPGYPLDELEKMRNRFYSEIPELREKLNTEGKYLGYSNGTESDAVYIDPKIRNQRTLIDIRISREHTGELRREGIEVILRQNWQYDAGWLTGVVVPTGIDNDKLNVVIELALLALKTPWGRSD